MTTGLWWGQHQREKSERNNKYNERTYIYDGDSYWRSVGQPWHETLESCWVSVFSLPWLAALFFRQNSQGLPLPHAEWSLIPHMCFLCTGTWCVPSSCHRRWQPHNRIPLGSIMFNTPHHTFAKAPGYPMFWSIFFFFIQGHTLFSCKSYLVTNFFPPSLIYLLPL